MSIIFDIISQKLKPLHFENNKEIIMFETFSKFSDYKSILPIYY